MRIYKALLGLSIVVVAGGGAAISTYGTTPAETKERLSDEEMETLVQGPMAVVRSVGLAAGEEAQRVVTDLAEAYRSNPALLPSEWRTAGAEAEQVRRIGDFIAGMTDRFAIARHRELIGAVELPDRF